MKRLHVHVSVEDLQHSIGFYSALFAAEPAIIKPDYAKWMLEDPRVNFAISTRGRQPGLDHLGIQVESKDELHEVYARLHKAGGEVIEQGETACCYAKSEKSWIAGRRRPCRSRSIRTNDGRAACVGGPRRIGASDPARDFPPFGEQGAERDVGRCARRGRRLPAQHVVHARRNSCPRRLWCTARARAARSPTGRMPMERAP
jgi:predicted enzyme related to lactoylglutathione lyase